MRKIPGDLKPFARERLTVTNAVKTLTSSVYDTNVGQIDNKRAQAAEVFVLTESINYTTQGTDPSGAAGATAVVTDDPIPLIGLQEVRKFKAFRAGATDSDIEVIYYA